VSIEIDSTPAGASVFLADATEAAGATPFKIDLPRGDGQQRFRVEAAGYQAVERVASLRRDAQLSVMLLPAPPTSTPRGKPPKKPATAKPPKRPEPTTTRPTTTGTTTTKPGLKDGAVINPFDKK
jgi:hypothetical protein